VVCHTITTSMRQNQTNAPNQTNKNQTEKRKIECPRL